MHPRAWTRSLSQFVLCGSSHSERIQLSPVRSAVFLIHQHTGNQWSWPINVTDFAAYNAEAIDSTDARLSNNTNSFTWPDTPESAEILPQKLGQCTEPQSWAAGRSINATTFCVTVVESFFPANVDTAWDARSDSCSGAIGDDCYNALVKDWESRKADYGEQGCRKGQDMNVNGIPGCYGTFGEWHATTLNLASSNATIRNGTAFYHKESAAYAGATSRIYDAEVLRLHMLIVDGGDFSIDCQRVNAATSLAGNDAVGAAQPDVGLVQGPLLV